MIKTISAWRYLTRMRNLWVALGLTVTVSCCLLMKVNRHYPTKEENIPMKNHLVGRNSDGEANDLVSLEICPPLPPNLKGRQKVEENVTLEEAEARVRGVKSGGLWAPSNCHPRWRVAVIVPYRGRYSQIGSFMNHMHPFLQRQELNYSIYIIEQEGDDLFNRARLLNVGFLEAQKEGPWDCFAFHDIDMLPEDDRHLYHCSQQPRHLAVATSNHNYRLVYYKYFGGACLMAREHIELVNGWSNIYWGWGGEDDDMWRRIDFSDMRVWRYHHTVARYRTIEHTPQVLNKNRYKTLERNTGRYSYDGLNSLRYEVRSVERRPLYSHILAYIGSSQAKTT
ncbi:beta-1,4-galactosyltransferase 4-like [Palaemon carinicauda]|uniref:beta-1,4-galactosyltransferase 4-like n=1 Tax=Palaemon carinicauda TaxID=392227 RepID=UPI0035B60E48